MEKEMNDNLIYYPSVGQMAPDFTAEAYHNKEIKTLSLYDYRKSWLVLFFYPGDFTFVCPTELASLAEKYQDIKNAGAEILAISTDSVYVHKAWHDFSPSINNIQYPLLSDKGGEISRDYMVYDEDQGVAMRGTFIIDPDGILRSVEINDASVGRNSDELIRKLRASKFTYENGDQACPANWQPDGKTLKPGLDLVGKL